jgi:hypothetical protein
MDEWTLILMLGVLAIWISMVSAVVLRIRLVRVRGLEPPRAARPSGT